MKYGTAKKKYKRELTQSQVYNPYRKGKQLRAHVEHDLYMVVWAAGLRKPLLRRWATRLHVAHAWLCESAYEKLADAGNEVLDGANYTFNIRFSLLL